MIIRVDITFDNYNIKFRVILITITYTINDNINSKCIKLIRNPLCILTYVSIKSGSRSKYHRSNPQIIIIIDDNY